MLSRSVADASSGCGGPSASGLSSQRELLPSNLGPVLPQEWLNTKVGDLSLTSTPIPRINIVELG